MAFRLPNTQLNTAQTFLDEVLKRVPEDQREEVRSLYSKASDEVKGIAAQITEAVGVVNQRAEEQEAWWAKNKKPAATPNPIAAAVDKDTLMKEVNTSIASTRDQLASDGLFLASVIPTIIAQHGVEFGEVLDGEKLVKDAIAAGTDIKTFYNGSVAEKRKAKADAKYASDIAAATEKGRLDGLKEAGTHAGNPYPSSRQVPTTLAGLRKPAEGTASPFTLDAAVVTAVDVMNKQQAS